MCPTVPILSKRLDVYPAPVPSPAVVLVHGGGWTRGDKVLPEIRDSSSQLQARGFAVFSSTTELQGPSPIYHIAPTTPPFLNVNSENEIVPVDQAQEMHDALTAAGRTSTLRIVSNETTYGAVREGGGRHRAVLRQ